MQDWSERTTKSCKRSVLRVRRISQTNGEVRNQHAETDQTHTVRSWNLPHKGEKTSSIPLYISLLIIKEDVQIVFIKIIC